MKHFRLFTNLIFIASLLLQFGSCSEAKKESENSHSHPSPTTTAKDTTLWKIYKGTIPCADCPGIVMELKLKDNFTVESYQFELKETYLEAENGKDKSYESKGMYNFWRGNSKDENATIIVLNDDSAESAKRFFLQLGDSVLKIVDNKGDEIDSKLNFSLRKVK